MNEFKYTKQVLEKYGHLIEEGYKQGLIDNDRIASRDLYNSVHTFIQDGNNYIELDLNLLSYWEQIEKGRGPTVNGGTGEVLDHIKEWIIQKNILPTPDSNGKLPTPDGLAYIITRKIHNEGYEGTPILKPLLEDLDASFEREIIEALDKDFDLLTDKVFLTRYKL